MLKDLVETFACKAINNSEIRKYWEAILKNICFVKDFIVADQAGNQDAYIWACKHFLPSFRGRQF